MIYLEIEAEVPYREWVEKNYGADADGNRGERRTFIEQDGEVIIHTQGLPPDVIRWAQEQAVKQWEETR